MPRRGHRKPLPLARQVYFRVSEGDYDQLRQEASLRCCTVSALLNGIVAGHCHDHPPSLPKAAAHQAALTRELARIGNNLNQLSRQANTGAFPINPADLQACLDANLAILRQL